MHYYIYADSKNRVAGSHGNNYYLTLTTPVKNVSRVDLVSAKIPNSMYNITDGSNTFAVNGTFFSVPSGFYSSYGLAYAITSVSSLLVDYLPDEGKFIFYSQSPFTFSATTDQMKRALGIDILTTSVHVNTTVYASYSKYSNYHIIKSESVIDLSTNEFVFLDIEELRTQCVIDSKSLVRETYEGSTIATTFGMIPMDVSSGQIKTFKETTDYKLSIEFKTPIASISRLTIRWLDKDGKNLSFNGFDNNAVLLRVHCETMKPEEPDPEIYEELLLKKIQRTIQDTIPPPTKPKKKYWLHVFALVALAMIGYKLFFSVKQPDIQSVIRTLPIHRSL